MATLSHSDQEMLLTAALRITDEVRNLILGFWNTRKFSVDWKEDATPVTEADRAAEALIRDRVRQLFPSHGVIGEEWGVDNPGAEVRWVIDPIDGTLHFDKGIPTFGTLIGILVGNEPLIGVIDHPALDLRCWGGRDLGTFRNGARVNIDSSALSAIEWKQVVALSSRDCFLRSGEEEVFDRLVSICPSTRVYYDCFCYSMVASGAIDAMVTFNDKLWDCAAVLPLVTAAGGKISYLKKICSEGKPTSYSMLLGRPALVDLLAKEFDVELAVPEFVP